MRGLTDIRKELQGKEILTTAQINKIKGGGASDDKRRPRPGGGSNTNCGGRPA